MQGTETSVSLRNEHLELFAELGLYFLSPEMHLSLLTMTQVVKTKIPPSPLPPLIPNLWESKPRLGTANKVSPSGGSHLSNAEHIEVGHKRQKADRRRSSVFGPLWRRHFFPVYAHFFPVYAKAIFPFHGGEEVFGLSSKDLEEEQPALEDFRLIARVDPRSRYS